MVVSTGEGSPKPFRANITFEFEALALMPGVGSASKRVLEKWSRGGLSGDQAEKFPTSFWSIPTGLGVATPLLPPELDPSMPAETEVKLLLKSITKTPWCRYTQTAFNNNSWIEGTELGEFKF